LTCRGVGNTIKLIKFTFMKSEQSEYESDVETSSRWCFFLKRDTIWYKNKSDGQEGVLYGDAHR